MSRAHIGLVHSKYLNDNYCQRFLPGLYIETLSFLELMEIVYLSCGKN